MDIKCSDEELFIFKKIGKAADELNVPVYVIGGFVRDKILNRPTKDADIVCVGDGIELAKKTAQQFHPIPEVNVFKNFGTAQIKLYSQKSLLPNESVFEIEFVGARKESYNYDSRKPEVNQGTLDEDRMRRDLTINTIAISLNKNDFGKLLDPLNGIADVEKKIIKTPLHPDLTFSDDPLRMMRAIRFATQLNFNIASETFESIKKNADRIKIVSAER